MNEEKILVSKEFAEIVSFDNMYKALKDSCRNVRWKESVVKYENNGLKNTARLVYDFLNNKYEIQPYRYMTVYEPKKRRICCTSIRDRQAQHCIVDNYFYDEITKGFIYDNFACQVGKGNHKFIKRLTQLLVKYYKNNNYSNEGYSLTLDVKNFFNTIPHDVAKQAVKKRIACKEVIDFSNKIIDGFDGEIGLFAGGQIVQLIALAVLDDLDHFIKEKLHIKIYMRYNDDMILIHRDKEYLKYCKNEIEKELNKIGLKLKNKKTRITSLDKGFKILHWRFRLTKSGKVIKYVEKSKLTKQRRKLKKLVSKEKEKLTDTEETDAIMLSWLNNMKLGNTYHHRVKMKKFLENLREEKGAIL